MFIFRYYKFGVEKRRSKNKREEPNFEDNPNAYIAAQINRFNYTGSFTIGDGQMYGGYHNVPLEKDQEYLIYAGASSGFNEVMYHCFYRCYSRVIYFTIPFFFFMNAFFSLSSISVCY